MTDQQKPVGELFARLYLDRGAPAQDSTPFRNRLEAFLQKNHYKDYSELASYLKQEAGLVVATSYLEKFGVYYNFSDFFTNSKIENVLSGITLIWRFLRIKYPQASRSTTPGKLSVTIYPQADYWQQFVARALREENLAYSLDEQCGVHYFVDEEFERNRVSILNCLSAPRYAGVRHAFEAAHKYLDTRPPDTKASVRSTFEAVEILARLMESDSKNLNKWLVANKLKARALSLATNATEIDTLTKLFDGLAEWVDGLHNYRHGQGTTEPVAPTLTLAIYVISTGGAAIRLLTEVDATTQRSA